MTREELNEDIQKEIIKEQNKELIKKIIGKTVKTIIILTIAITLFLTYTTYVSTTKVITREYRIINKKIPDSFNGIKIIQLSDLHYGNTTLLENLKEIVKITNTRKPDIVIFSGDLISPNYKLKQDEQEKITKELQKINATLGKYAVLGDEDEDTISTIFNQSEFNLLKNEYDLIYNNENTPILLIGINPIDKNQNIDEAYKYFKEETHNKDIYTITSFHEPDTLENISYHSDLYLAGHSHNGNIQIPIINYPIIKYKNAKKYNKEYYKIDDSELYISSGLGTNKVDIRLFCRPSINFFRISNN